MSNDVEVGDLLLYTGKTSSDYTNGKYYNIYKISGFLGYFYNDSNTPRVFMITKPNGYCWEHIKLSDFRKDKIDKIRNHEK